jgi:hypothetical protein
LQGVCHHVAFELWFQRRVCLCLCLFLGQYIIAGTIVLYGQVRDDHYISRELHQQNVFGLAAVWFKLVWRHANQTDHTPRK